MKDPFCLGYVVSKVLKTFKERNSNIVGYEDQPGEKMGPGTGPLRANQMKGETLHLLVLS